MPERDLNERATIEQTVRTLQVAGDMFLSGRELAVKYINSPPYIPTIEELADHITTEVPEFTTLTEWERSFLLVNGLMTTYQLMANRAEYQSIYFQSPLTVKHNLLRKIFEETEGQVDLNPDKVQFKWSPFSMALVAKQEDFNKTSRYFFPNEKEFHGSGYIGPYATSELGPMPIILNNKYLTDTLLHEDIHRWHIAMGYIYSSGFDFSKALDDPVVIRCVNNENIQNGDFKHISENLYSGILSLAKSQIYQELAASLWSREQPSTEILFGYERDKLEFTTTCLINALYHPSSKYSEKEQINQHINLQMKVYEIEKERRILVSSILKAVNSYRGNKNKWEWAAARLTVVPPESSLKMFQAVLFGRHLIPEFQPKVKYSHLLAEVLVTHARRKTLPDAYGQGGQILRDLVPTFYDILLKTLKDTYLYQEFLVKYNIGHDQMSEVKKIIIKYAAKSVPNGLRGETRRVLQSRL